MCYTAVWCLNIIPKIWIASVDDNLLNKNPESGSNFQIYNIIGITKKTKFTVGR